MPSLRGYQKEFTEEIVHAALSFCMLIHDIRNRDGGDDLYTVKGSLAHVFVSISEH